MINWLARTVRVVLVCALVAVATAPDASADAAGPTDYNTEIVSIEPASPSVHLSMIGGDSFLSLEQLEPVEVIVLGYQAEPYLRFEPNGSVFENFRSPAVWLNQERYGSEDPPAFADPDARPEWKLVAEDGRYAWHDHRSHWMNPQRPPGAEPGDQVLEATIPLQIDGVPVTVTVASYLLDGPSVAVPIVAALAALAFATTQLRFGRTFRASVTGLVGAIALTFGIVAFTSVPAVTEPSSLLWLLPAIALVASQILLVIRNRTATTVYLDGLVVAAGSALIGWVYIRRTALSKALIPSDAPAGLDRFMIILALGVGLVAVGHGILGLVRPERLIEQDSHQ